MSDPRARASAKASSFTESVIRDMTRLADRFGAINLGQGYPDFPAPQAVKDAAHPGDRRGSQPVPRDVGHARVP